MVGRSNSSHTLRPQKKYLEEAGETQKKPQEEAAADVDGRRGGTNATSYSATNNGVLFEVNETAAIREGRGTKAAGK